MIGHGCNKCAGVESKKRYTGVKKIHKLDKKTIIKRLNKIHKDYDYTKCNMMASNTLNQEVDLEEILNILNK